MLNCLLQILLSSIYVNMGDQWITEANDVIGGDDEPLGQSETPEVKLFGKWSLDEVHISDISLVVSVLSIFRNCEVVEVHGSCLLLMKKLIT